MDIQDIVSGLASSDALTKAAGQAGISPDQAQSALQGILEHAQGGGAAQGLAETIAAKAGLSAEQVQAFLPQVTSLLQGHAQNAPEGAQGDLGGLISSVSGLLGAGAAEGPAGGLLDMAKGLFGQKT